MEILLSIAQQASGGTNGGTNDDVVLACCALAAQRLGSTRRTAHRKLSIYIVHSWFHAAAVLTASLAKGR